MSYNLKNLSSAQRKTAVEAIKKIKNGGKMGKNNKALTKNLLGLFQFSQRDIRVIYNTQKEILLVFVKDNHMTTAQSIKQGCPDRKPASPITS